MEYTLSTLDGITSEMWDGYVDNHSNATIYHHSCWREVIGRAFGHKADYLVALDENRQVVGLLPTVEVKSRLFGHYMVSMPFFTGGGALSDNSQVDNLLMKSAVGLARQRKVSHVEFRESVERDAQWPVRSDKVTMLLALPPTVDELSRQIGSKARSQIRRPDREGVSVKHGNLDLIDDFYTVFSRNMRDLGTPVYASSFFKIIAETLKERVKIVVVYLKNRPVAAGYLLSYKGRVEIPWASSLREYNRVGVNMRLYWEVLKYSIECGYKTFDFGRSSKGEGTYRFKAQWGAQPQPCYWHYWLNDGVDLPQLNPANPKYELAINIWRRLPLAVANMIGPFVIKNLP